MAGELNYPAPHAAVYNSFPATFAQKATGGIIISNWGAGASNLTLTTVGGESLLIAFGTTAVSNNPVYLPIQVAAITAANNVGTVTALWH